jgi:hypothetical protein
MRQQQIWFNSTMVIASLAQMVTLPARTSGRSCITLIPLAAKNEVFAYSTPAIKGLTSHRARNKSQILKSQAPVRFSNASLVQSGALRDRKSTWPWPVLHCAFLSEGNSTQRREDAKEKENRTSKFGVPTSLRLCIFAPLRWIPCFSFARSRSGVTPFNDVLQRGADTRTVRIGDFGPKGQ